jgi:hypothetical protein
MSRMKKDAPAVGGDSIVGAWPGVVTATIYTAAARVRGKYDCTFAEALLRLRGWSDGTRHGYGMRNASHEEGRWMVEALIKPDDSIK